MSKSKSKDKNKAKEAQKSPPVADTPKPVADTAKTEAPANEAPSLPGSDLEMPEFLKRTDTPEQIQAVRDKTVSDAKQRVIKNPPDAKAKVGKASTDALNEMEPLPHTEDESKDRAPSKGSTSKRKRGGSKTGLIADLLLRKEGCTRDDILEVTGWPSVSVPAMAKAAGLKLRKEKTKGGKTHYFGSK